MKACTNLPRSKKLAEFLPLESADMIWVLANPDLPMIRAIAYEDSEKSKYYEILPAWSLAALLSVFPMVVGRDLDMYCCWQNSKNLHSRHYDNPVDACVEMIIKLHEQKLL